MNIFKKFWLWFGIFSSSICVYNATGYDDKGIILSIVDPISWCLDLVRYFISFKTVAVNPFISYTATILFWMLAGYAINYCIKIIKKHCNH